MRFAWSLTISALCTGRIAGAQEAAVEAEPAAEAAAVSEVEDDDATVTDDGAASQVESPADDRAADDSASNATEGDTSAAAASTDDPSLHVGAPPPVTFPESPHEEVADPPTGRWWEQPEPPPRRSSAALEDLTITVGLQNSWLSNKVVVGPSFALGISWFWVDLDTAFLFVPGAAPELSSHYLGNRWGIAAGVAVLDTKRLRGRLGIGVDHYALWGIHKNEHKTAFALRGDLTYWISESWGLEAGLRSYPLASTGLVVASGPGTAPVPVFFTTALLFRFPDVETEGKWK